MRRLIRSNKINTQEKKAREIQYAINYAQNFTIRLQNSYNELTLRLPLVRSLLDIQAVQIYQIMIEKLKKSIVAFNKSTITDKLNLIVQQMHMYTSSKNKNALANKVYDILSKNINKKSHYTNNVVDQAKQLKEDLLHIRDELDEIYDQGETLAEITKNLLDFHAKNSVLKRIRNVKTVVRWINNEDGLDTDIIGRLDKLIYGDIPNRKS